MYSNHDNAVYLAIVNRLAIDMIEYLQFNYYYTSENGVIVFVNQKICMYSSVYPKSIGPSDTIWSDVVIGTVGLFVWCDLQV